MANIFESKITASNVRAIWESKERKPALGEVFFPSTKQLGLDINLIKGKDDTPIALVSANWDTDVLYRDRIGFEQLTAEMPYFKEAYKVSEKLRQQIITSQEQYRTPFFNQIFKDIDNLVESADVTTERMRMQILGTGTISIQENGVDKQYDYGFDNATHLVTEQTLWSASGAKPFASLVKQCKNYKKLVGESPKYVVMNTDVFDTLASDTEIIGYFQNLSTPNLYPNDDDVMGYIEQKLKVTILIADGEYIKARDFKTRTKVPYYPQDRYTLLSTVDLGETVYGSTPEEIDLISGDSEVLNGEVLGNGVSVTMWKEKDPVVVITKVSEVVLPSCPNIDKVYIVKVL